MERIRIFDNKQLGNAENIDKLGRKEYIQVEKIEFCITFYHIKATYQITEKEKIKAQVTVSAFCLR